MVYTGWHQVAALSICLCLAEKDVNATDDKESFLQFMRCLDAAQGTDELKALQQGQINSSTMQFIDFEYGSYNYRGFDFGNHWCEYAGFEGDYSRYPDTQQQAAFLKAYLQQQGNKSPVRSQSVVSGCYM